MNIGLLICGCVCDLTGILAFLYSIDLYYSASAFAAAKPKAIGAAALAVVFFFAGAMCLRAAVQSLKENRGQSSDGNV